MADLSSTQEVLGDILKSPQPTNPTVSKKQKEDAFYAAAQAPDSNKELVYNKILDELRTAGHSPYVDKIKERWKQEQEDYAKIYTKEKLLDPNVSVNEKRGVVEAYASGGMVDPNLRTQFAERSSEKDMGKSLKDTQSQNIRQTTPLQIEVVGGTIAAGSKQDLERADLQKTFLQKLQEAGGKFIDAGAEYAKYFYNKPGEASSGLVDVARTIGSGLAHTTAAGFAGMFMIAKENQEEADGLVKQITEAIYKGDGEGYEEGMKALSALGELIDVPFKALADEAYDATESPLVGSLVYAIPQAFGYAAGGWAGAKAVVGGAKASVAAKEAIKAANPFSSVKHNKEYEEIIGPSGEAYYKKKLKQSTGIRTEPIIHDLDKVDPTSPASVVAQTNPPAAIQIGASAVADSTGKLADSMGTTRAELLNTWMLSKLDPELETTYPDIYNALVRKDLEAQNIYLDTEIDNYLFDSSRVNNDIDRYFAVINEQKDIHMNIPNSYIERAGDVMRGKIRFTRNDSYGWTDPHDALRMATKLNKTLKNHGLWSRKSGDPELGNGYQWSQIKVDYNDTTKEYSLVWDFQKKFDAEQDLFFGNDVIKANFGPWDVSGLAATKIGTWLFNPAVRLPLWLTEGMSRADIRASRLEKLFAETLRANVLKHGTGKEIAAAIYKSEETGKYLSVQDIKEMYPHLPETKVKNVIEGYQNYRRMTEYMYNISNRSARSHYIKSGQHGLYNGEEYLGVGRPLRRAEDGISIDPKEFEKGGAPDTVWDFITGTAIPVNGKLDRPGYTLARLYRPIHKNGQSFDYAWVEKADGPLPKQVLPKIDGYFPHINKEPYFITLVPNEVKANGKVVTDPIEIEKYQETIGVAHTEKDAIEYAKRLQEEHPEAKVWYRPERYDSLDDTITNLDIAKFNLDVMKSRKKDRLMLPDETLGRLEDPAVALYDRMQQVVRLDAWKDIDLEFRKQFVDSYKQFLTDGQFPSEQYPLRLPKNLSPQESKAYNSAVKLLEHYKTQQHQAALSDKWHKTWTIGLAKKLENVPALADFVREHAKDPTIWGRLTQLTTMKYIHLNPYRQWLLQPAQVTELAPMALATGNTKFIHDASSLAHPIFQAIVGDASVLAPTVKDFLKKDLYKSTGLSPEEFSKIVEAFKKTGIPTAIDLNSVLHGVFREAGRGLEEGIGTRAWEGIKQGALAIPNLGKTMGFSGAELLNNIFLFLYAKSDFETRFPDKKWDDPHNLELIAAKALSTGNTMMGRGDQFFYQKGVLRSVMQFMSYPHKAMLQPFMSKTLTTQEKVAMFTARMFLFGTKGLSGVSGVERILNATVPKDATLPAELSEDGQEGGREKVLELLRNGLLNEITNAYFNTFIDQGDVKTQLDIAKSINPIGDTGIPFGDFMLGMWDFVQGDKSFSRTMPFLSMASSFTDAFNDIWTIWNARKIEEMGPEEVTAMFSRAAQWASGFNNYEKYLLMRRIEDYETKTGQKLGFNITATESLAKVFGIPSAKEQVLFDIGRLEKDRLKYLDDTARRIIKDLNTIEDVYGTQNVTSPEEFSKMYKELTNRISFLVDLYAIDGMQEELLIKVWDEDKKRQEEGLPSVVSRIMKRKQYEIDTYRQREIKALDKIRQSDPAAAEALEMMFYDIKNFDKEETNK